jgi:hypothetical protein
MAAFRNQICTTLDVKGSQKVSNEEYGCDHFTTSSCDLSVDEEIDVQLQSRPFNVKETCTQQHPNTILE